MLALQVAVPLQVLAQLQPATLALKGIDIVFSPLLRASDHFLHALRRRPPAQQLAGQSCLTVADRHLHRTVAGAHNSTL